MSKKITISNKCIINTTLKAMVFSTRTAKSDVFTIPNSQIIKSTIGGIYVNERHIEPATDFEITDWIYSKNKPFFDKMNQYDFREK